MLQDLFNNLRVFNARYDLYFATAFLALFYFDGEDPLQPLGPEKNSASSNRSYLWRVARPAPIQALAFQVRHEPSTCYVARKHHETLSGSLSALDAAGQANAARRPINSIGLRTT